MSSLSDPGLRRVKEASLALFARHGFQRTSMADIAREARISRATLYLRFADKRALFAALAQAFVDDALAAAQSAWQDGAPLARNIAAMLLAKDLAFFRLERTTPHGKELLTADADVARAEGERLAAGFRDMLRGRAVQSGANLSVFGGPDGFASFLSIAGAGLKHETADEAAYVAAVEMLGAVTARAIDEAVLL